MHEEYYLARQIYTESILSKFSFAAWIPYKSDVLCRHGV
jgi:hypothetical protein